MVGYKVANFGSRKAFKDGKMANERKDNCCCCPISYRRDSRFQVEFFPSRGKTTCSPHVCTCTRTKRRCPLCGGYTYTSHFHATLLRFLHFPIPTTTLHTTISIKKKVSKPLSLYYTSLSFNRLYAEDDSWQAPPIGRTASGIEPSSPTKQHAKSVCRSSLQLCCRIATGIATARHRNPAHEPLHRNQFRIGSGSGERFDSVHLRRGCRFWRRISMHDKSAGEVLETARLQYALV